MLLRKLTLETSFFEDYLSFFTEVLELDLHELTEESMQLHLQGSILEIRKGECTSPQLVVEFQLEESEYAAMVQKISFFYYRKGPTRFLLRQCDNINCLLIDPDGRSWRFSQPVLKQTHFSQEALS
jgi:hypothetical protein